MIINDTPEWVIWKVFRGDTATLNLELDVVLEDYEWSCGIGDLTIESNELVLTVSDYASLEARNDFAVTGTDGTNVYTPIRGVLEVQG